MRVEPGGKQKKALTKRDGAPERAGRDCGWRSGGYGGVARVARMNDEGAKVRKATRQGLVSLD